MKKVIALLLVCAIVFCLFSTFTSATVSSNENVNVVKAATNSINIDGIMSSGEWDGAQSFTVNADTAGFTAKPADLSVTYHLKWDDTYLYIAEERTQTDPLKYLVDSQELLSGQFYQGDSTLFFMWFDNGTTPDIKNQDERDIQYSADSPSEGPLYGMRVAEGNTRSQFTDPGMIASTVKGNKSVIELKFKWSDLPGAVGNIKDGAKIRFYVCDTKTLNDVNSIALWNDWSAQDYQLVWGAGMDLDMSDWNTMTLTDPSSATPTPTLAPTATPVPTSTPAPTPVPVVKPAAPTSLKATISHNSATLTWKAVSGAKSYYIYYNTKSTGTFAYDTTKATKLVITGLKKSTKYYFKVAAVNSNGEGKTCSVISAKTAK